MSRVEYPLPTDERNASEMLRDMDDFFAGRGPVHTTLRRLADRFELENLPYAVIGGMALYLLGYERQTVVVDILMTTDGLQAFHDRLVGRGYRPAFSGARKTFRDTETGVKVDVITTGEYPGDGKPKPVCFPDPTSASLDRSGYRVITPEKFIEVKLAAGLSAPHRELIDLADVQRFIEEVHLPLEFAEKLDPSVREEYRRLWELAQHTHEGPGERS
jgi:hypothetical protein